MRGLPGLGVITIGQSPRADVLPDFIAALGFEPRIVQRGLLDGLGPVEIASMAPAGAGGGILVTRLRDGSEAKLSEGKVVGMLPQAVKYLEGMDVGLIALFCTGEFPPVDSEVPVLYPSAIVGALVSALFASARADRRRLCVVAPAKEQYPMLARKWESSGCGMLFESVSPYASADSGILACAGRVARLPCDMIVLDCFGFTEKARKVFAEATGKPVILPRTLLARVVAEMLAG